MAEIDPNTPVYSIGVVKEMTGLTRRQIRYYEDSELIKPARTKGNQRIYSQNDIEKLNKIKKLLDNGLNIAGIQEQLGTVKEEKNKEEEKIDDESLNEIRVSKEKLTSLYPVSNRASLVKLLSEDLEPKDK
ncbi:MULTISPECIES: MerR family transcriptional regulator [unclassified Candidatus Frackibacter]|uniref:MerR family transcriptional regulator n=1 Tax=unclassified Candidatus Frackibacter TaxID=2648818 RepID=UPI00088CECB3|nr:MULTISPECIES: MerR family transcriptional regulator [unclassified Candidatus Frackibacter]SDC66241.1 MerR family transcriptional regulator, glutamine synthetase repressor [Candidatus Frackibacter sp. WG11]SEM79354.1 MerR family transcriptional regulator, glutamine synthetase repressor [Candidatus Frackibacter sp. WG12]SFL90127.1 MerR family transcriptional regulator, glutamine synthetase repressor [Candidatus Frackibacter sp. WG13]